MIEKTSTSLKIRESSFWLGTLLKGASDSSPRSGMSLQSADCWLCLIKKQFSVSAFSWSELADVFPGRGLLTSRGGIGVIVPCPSRALVNRSFTQLLPGLETGHPVTVDQSPAYDFSVKTSRKLYFLSPFRTVPSAIHVQVIDRPSPDTPSLTQAIIVHVQMVYWKKWGLGWSRRCSCPSVPNFWMLLVVSPLSSLSDAT